MQSPDSEALSVEGEAEALHERGMALVEQGRKEEALPCLECATRLAPDSSRIRNNLGVLQEDLGQRAEALESYGRAIELAPSSAMPRLNLGCLLLKQNETARAIDCLRIAATLEPALAEAWSSLGQALLQAGQPGQALGALRRALELSPSQAAVHLQLGDGLRAVGRFSEALPCYRGAIELDPRQGQAWLALGHTQLALREHGAALESLGRAVLLDPQSFEVHHELGKALFELGIIEPALDHLRVAVRLGDSAQRPLALKMIAVIVPGDPRAGPEEVLTARRAFGATLPSQARPNWQHPAARERIVVGFLGSFLHYPNWMKPVWSLMHALDREHVEVHLFSDVPEERIRQGMMLTAGDGFHPIGGLDNASAAACIAAVGIDVLVDLNGYSRPDRLGVLALRPARRIIGWFNLYATSGLNCVDYLIGDELVLAPGEERDYVERLIRLPGSYLTFEVKYPVPDVGPAPCLERGFLTFGCLASQYKLTDAVLESWGRILRASPSSRLLVRNQGLGASSDRAHFVKRLTAVGIDLQRVELLGPCDHAEFLETYARMDVALDAFPYNGGTTTTEALWQGVPVIAFRGDRWASRTSASLLAAAGLGEFFAADVGGYESLAIGLAADPRTPQRLGELRATLRDRLRRSPVCDTRAFARAFEAMLREVVASPI